MEQFISESSNLISYKYVDDEIIEKRAKYIRTKFIKGESYLTIQADLNNLDEYDNILNKCNNFAEFRMINVDLDLNHIIPILKKISKDKLLHEVKYIQISKAGESILKIDNIKKEGNDGISIILDIAGIKLFQNKKQDKNSFLSLIFKLITEVKDDLKIFWMILISIFLIALFFLFLKWFNLKLLFSFFLLISSIYPIFNNLDSIYRIKIN